MASVDDFLKSLDSQPKGTPPKERRAKRLPKCRDCGKRFDPVAGPRRRWVRCGPCRDALIAARDAACAAQEEAREERAREIREERESRWRERSPGPLTRSELMNLGRLIEPMERGGGGHSEDAMVSAVDEFVRLLTATSIERADFVQAGKLLARMETSYFCRDAIPELRIAFLAVHGGLDARWSDAD